MPYHIGKEGSYGCNGYPVVKDSDGTVMGCHKTEDAAKKQLAALYINEPEANKAAGFTPPAEVRANAKRGLELRAKYNRGGTEVGVARARDLSNGTSVSLDTLKRMNSFFARHEVDKKGEGWGKDSAGYIAWLLWGGDAGWSWAKRTINEQENKEKSTMSDLTTSYFGIEKADRNADGTLTVYGKATDDALDIDQQICDADWLERAMPNWFKSGGNIREQHSNIAAGVAKQYESKADGHYISALVVDPVSVKKVETGVLKGFSIGIKNPRVTRDKVAANGRIVDGQIVEVSLVDRPANPNCQLVLAKSASGESTLIQVEDLIEKEDKKPDYEGMLEGGENSEPTDKELYNRVKAEAKEKFDVYPSAVANSWVVREYKKRGGEYKRKAKKSLQFDDPNLLKEANMKKASDIIELAKSLQATDVVKFDQATYDTARNALAQLIQIEAKEMETEGSDEQNSIAQLLEAVHHLMNWYQGEKLEGEVMEEILEMSADKDSHIKSTVGCDCAGCEKCGKAGGCDKAMCKGHDSKSMMKNDEEKSAHKELKPAKNETKSDYMKRCKEAGMDDKTIKALCDKYMSEEADTEKSTNTNKCLECGCHKPEESHGGGSTVLPDGTTTAHMSTADIVAPNETPKSAEADETPTEEKDSADEKPAEIEAIVEQVVESATKALKTEIASLVSAKEAAETKAISLESELAIAKSQAVAGGPKRTAKPVGETSNDLFVKSATYREKAKATTDPTLAKGYKQLADEFLAKATEATSK